MHLISVCCNSFLIWWLPGYYSEIWGQLLILTVPKPPNLVLLSIILTLLATTPLYPWSAPYRIWASLHHSLFSGVSSIKDRGCKYPCLTLCTFPYEACFLAYTACIWQHILSLYTYMQLHKRYLNSKRQLKLCVEIRSKVGVWPDYETKTLQNVYFAWVKSEHVPYRFATKIVIVSWWNG